MNFSVACALNLYLNYKMQSEGKGKILTTQVSKNIRHVFERYFNHFDVPSYTSMCSLYSLIHATTASLPFEVSQPTKDVENNVAIDFGGRLMLLYWNRAVSSRSKWVVNRKNLEGYVCEEYQFNEKVSVNGEMLTLPNQVRFDFCNSTFENISFLRVLGWHIYTDYRRVRELPEVDGLDSRLFPFQKEGVRMLCAGYRLMADEMGCGKSAQTLQFIQVKNFQKVLIICPATLKLNWAKEIKMWVKGATDKDISVLSGTQTYRTSTRFTIINYDLLMYWEKELCATEWQCALLDEAHYIQSDVAKRTQSFLRIKKHCKDVVFMTGTPFTSRPFQMFTALHCIAPKVFTTAQEFGNRFCTPVVVKGNTQYKGGRNLDILHDILQDGICIRRLKEDVLKELPEKMRVTIPIGRTAEEVKDNPVIYEQIVALEKKIAEAKSAFGTIEFQRQIASLRKIGMANAWIRLFLESGKKLVVFGVHTATLDAITSEFGTISVRIDGSVSMKKRQEAVDRFQTDPSIRLFVANIQSAATGITLTAASDTLFLELPWCFSEASQAEDRIYRIGQKNACTIWYATCPDSLDDMMVESINRKAQMHNRIFDGKNDELIPKENIPKYRAMFYKVN